MFDHENSQVENLFSSWLLVTNFGLLNVKKLMYLFQFHKGIQVYIYNIFLFG